MASRALMRDVAPMVRATGASERNRALHTCLSSGVPARDAAADAPLRLLRLMCTQCRYSPTCAHLTVRIAAHPISHAIPLRARPSQLGHHPQSTILKSGDLDPRRRREIFWTC